MQRPPSSALRPGTPGYRPPTSDPDELSGPEFRKWVDKRFSWETTDLELAAFLKRFSVPGKKNMIDVKKFLATLSNQSRASHNPKKMSTIQELPHSLKSSRWTKDKLEMRIKEKIEARSKGHGFPNYFRVFCDQGENVSDRITLDKEGLRTALQTKLSIHVDDEELEWLFSKWDSNNSGEIDLQEFLRQLLPKDYTADDPWSYQEPREPGKSISYQKPPAAAITAQMTGDGSFLPMDLTIEQLKTLIRDKIQERMNIEGNCFMYQRAYRMLTEGQNVSKRQLTRPILREKLIVKFGLHLRDEDFESLFDQFDKDNNGVIDMAEFMNFFFDPDYIGDKQVWNASSSDHYDIRMKKPENYGPVSSHIVEKAPKSLENHKWTTETLKNKLIEKIQERLGADGNCFQFQHCYRLFCQGKNSTSRSGITKELLKEKLMYKFAISVTDAEVDAVFDSLDLNGDGVIDLFEFMKCVLPPDYTRQQGFGPDGNEHHKIYQEYKKRMPTANPRLRGNSADEPETVDSAASAVRAAFQRALLLKSGSKSGAYNFKNIYALLKEGFGQSGIVNSRGLFMVMNRKLNMEATMEDADLLLATFDNGSGQPLSIQAFIRALLPQDFDGTHHLTPKTVDEMSETEKMRRMVSSMLGALPTRISMSGASRGGMYEEFRPPSSYYERSQGPDILQLSSPEREQVSGQEGFLQGQEGSSHALVARSNVEPRRPTGSRSRNHSRRPKSSAERATARKLSKPIIQIGDSKKSSSELSNRPPTAQESLVYSPIKYDGRYMNAARS